MKEIKLDDLDLKIIYLLREDSRLRISDIAKALDLSRPTVYSRIKRLEESGVIKGYTIKLDKKIEYGANLVILLIRTKDISKILDNESIVEIYRLTSNRYFIIANINSVADIKTIEEAGDVEIIETMPVLEFIEGKKPLRIKVRFKCDYCGKEILEEPLVYYHKGKVYFFCCKTCLREFKKLIKEE